ncbi:hypothetical protein HAX54_028075, partial [Datura stramonium]|nr:hypothetical protein [Datura stramonium]
VYPWLSYWLCVVVVLIDALGLVDTQRTRVFSAEGLSPTVDRPTGLRIMSSIVSNQGMIREWSDMSEPSWDSVGSPRWIELSKCTVERWSESA